jgi:tetratricopeptide (TPR) repeat protein
MDQAMVHILNDIVPKETKRKQTSYQLEKNLAKQNRRKPRHFFRWMLPLLFVSFMVLLVVFGYMNYTSEYQMKRGHYYLQQKVYTEAIKHYEKAAQIDPADANIQLYLAKCFKAMDKLAGYEASLTNVIQNEDALKEQLNLAYTGLATLYLEKQEYQKIAKLLKTCKDVQVIEQFGKYRAQLPKFSHSEGEYDDIIPLKIQGGEKGIIYYTTDGADPTKESKEYTKPIFLDKGEYVIKAIYVNEFGVSSEIITGKFIIKF